MFIELTDHLRCPADHPEAFLVLLPDRMEGRNVVSGTLGCPVCGRTAVIRDGVIAMGNPSAPSGATSLTGEAIATFLGVEGPGGHVALVGNAAAVAGDFARRCPGVHLVLVNPPPGIPGGVAGGVVHGARFPLRRHSMRGLAIGSDLARDTAWVDAAIGAVLPGLRFVVEQAVPESLPAGTTVLGATEQCWIGRTGR